MINCAAWECVVIALVAVISSEKPFGFVDELRNCDDYDA